VTEEPRYGGWFDQQAAKEASKDVLRLSDRMGQVVGAVISLLVALYFIDLYTSSSGFFTSSFTTADAILFFGIAFLGIIPGLARAVIGRKNVTRPLEIILSISILIATSWFLYTFPFDFSHLADALPSSLQFLLSWISDSIAKVLMVIAIIGTICIIPYTTLLYMAVRRKLLGSASG
jgi:hypothetical protein